MEVEIIIIKVHVAGWEEGQVQKDRERSRCLEGFSRWLEESPQVPEDSVVSHVELRLEEGEQGPRLLLADGADRNASCRFLKNKLPYETSCFFGQRQGVPASRIAQPDPGGGEIWGTSGGDL